MAPRIHSGGTEKPASSSGTLCLCQQHGVLVHYCDIDRDNNNAFGADVPTRLAVATLPKQ